MLVQKMMKRLKKSLKSAIPEVAPDKAAANMASAGKPQHSACNATTAA
ncbi:MAG: hypothetical protein M0D54_06865 [Hyphomonadaceae bacterium JAD_PAG50586_4]|nr:MAG: hypothetical protein M0D54_06865 [Hyphomonadaceae bacterium JAD_PAG50586_4]